MACGPPAGAAFGLLQELYLPANAAFWCFTICAGVWAAASVALWARRAGLREAPAIAALCVAMLYGVVIGDFAAYAGGVGGRTLDEYALDMPWFSGLAFSLLLAGLFGLVLGLIAALAAAYVYRRARAR